MTEKSNLGLKVFGVAAIIYAVALFGGTTPLLLVAGYCLIKETNYDLRKIAVKAVVLNFVFLVINRILVSVLNGVFWLANKIVELIGGSYYAGFSIGSIISFVEFVVFMILIIAALAKKNIKLPVIDDFADKLLEKNEEN